MGRRKTHSDIDGALVSPASDRSNRPGIPERHSLKFNRSSSQIFRSSFCSMELWIKQVKMTAVIRQQS